MTFVINECFHRIWEIDAGTSPPKVVLIPLVDTYLTKV